MTGYEVFKDVVIPILAAILGGLITFLGVLLTINKADKVRREDEIKKARPLFSFHGLRQIPQLDSVMQHVCISDSEEPDKYKCDVYVELENSNLSSFEIKRLYHDGVWVGVEGNTVVLPGARCILNFRFADKPTCIFLEVEDALSNKHYYQLFVLFLWCKEPEGINYHTIREIKLISKENMDKIMKEKAN